MPSIDRRQFLAGSISSLAAAPLLAQAENTQPGELARIKAVFQSEDPAVWVMTGDSITHGALHTHGARSYPEHFAERVRWEMGRVRDVVVNTGISGDRVPGLLKDFQHRIARWEPTVVSIMMGMNDATAGPEGREAFRADYLQLIDRIRSETQALVLLHTPNPITPAATGRQDLPAYAQIVREVAETQGVALVDQEKMWKGYLSAKGKDLNYLLNDGTIHPNAYGHVFFAHCLFKTLGIFDPDAWTCRLYVP